MELKEIRKKSDAELKKSLAEQREKLREFRFKVSTKQHKIVSDVKKVKINISRILTVLQERKLNPVVLKKEKAVQIETEKKEL